MWTIMIENNEKLKRYMYYSHPVFWHHGQEWASLLFWVKEYYDLWKGIVITNDLESVDYYDWKQWQLNNKNNKYSNIHQ